jgi:hypothetical protein
VQDLNQIDTTELDASAFNLPPAITPRSTRAQRRFAHRARMEGKVYDREHLPRQRSEITTKAQFRRLIGYTSIAQFNRHTRKPHENAREIMRRTMSVAERRAFTAQVAGFMAAGQQNLAA